MIFECTISGEVGATVWSGNAIDCQVITLLHLRRFLETRGCSNGATSARGVKIEENCYTSILNLTVYPDTVGKSVECIYNNGTDISLIGNSSVTLTSGMYYYNNDACF